jgi:hypothetical protein
MNKTAMNKYERKDLVIVKTDGKDVEAEVMDVKFQGGKYIYTLDKIEKPVPEIEIKRAASNRVTVARELVRIAKSLTGI